MNNFYTLRALCFLTAILKLFYLAFLRILHNGLFLKKYKMEGEGRREDHCLTFTSAESMVVRPLKFIKKNAVVNIHPC